MYPHASRWLAILLICAGTVMGDDIPYVFGDDGGKALEDSSYYIIDENSDEELNYSVLPPETPEVQPLVENIELDDTDVPFLSDYDDSDVIVFTTASSPDGGGCETVSRTVGAIQTEINEKVDVENPITRNTAVVIAAKYPGEYNIDQIVSIYDYLQDGWHYVNDPRGIDYYSSASETLQLGKELDCIGAGDCDDFAILMSALIESIGGTTRVILAYNQNSGHAYSEVYLGQVNNTAHHVEDTINWLKSEYNTDAIYTHVDQSTQDVWLNLDWGRDENNVAHPGGPFYRAERQRPLIIRGELTKVAPRLPEGYVSVSRSTTAATYGAIQGQVVDENGNPLIAKVLLTDEYGNSQLAITDRYGNYEIDLEPGTYTITAEKTGYYFEEISANVRSGREITVPIHGEEEFVVSSGVTLGEAYSWSGDDESLADYYV